MKLLKLKTQFLTLIIFSAVILFSSSCKKDEVEDCTSDALGTYVGTESCVGSNNNITMAISTSSQEDQVVVSITGTSFTFNGELSSNCGTVSIPSQNLVGGGGVTVSGSFNINGNNMNGTLNISGSVCSYNLTKQ
ncbi:MAG: hypothetical protein ACPGVB_01115 [Chitinophagales bacterium]